MSENACMNILFSLASELYKTTFTNKFRSQQNQIVAVLFHVFLFF